MKNKIPITLAIIAFVFLTIAISVKLVNLFTEETYTVTINYSIDGEEKPFKVYSEKHAEGEQIYLKSPEKKGYIPNKEFVSFYVASDLNVSVVYNCIHEASIAEDIVLIYPTSGKPGTLQRHCLRCDTYYNESFTTLTRSLTFGGEELKDMYFNAAGVYNGYTYTGGELVLLKNYAPELDCLFNGIDMSQENWADGFTVKIEYDGWNETVAFCQDLLADISETFKVRFGNDWRIIMHYSPHVSGNLNKWLNSDSCPLRTSPLRITMTYDFTK